MSSTRRQRLFTLAPLLITLTAFILALLTLLAGYKPGFMSDTHIILLDTSQLGESLLPLATTAKAKAPKAPKKPKAPKAPKAPKTPKKPRTGKEDEDEDEDLQSVTDALGVERFYALHAMTVCSGQYANGEDSSDGLNPSRCTEPLAELNVLSVVDLDLRIPGPIRAAIADVANAAPKIFRAMAGLFIAGVVLAGLATLGGIVSLLLPGAAPVLAVLNVLVHLLASVMLLSGTLLTTVGGDKLAGVIEDKGGRIGLHAQAGSKFRGLSWASFVITGLAALVWAFGFFAVYRRRA
ncbi:hypothetical protein RB601_006130 [Gaeumannomyces tritici]